MRAMTHTHIFMHPSASYISRDLIHISPILAVRTKYLDTQNRRILIENRRCFNKLQETIVIVYSSLFEIVYNKIKI